jgi:hypothetical protein
MLCKNFWDSKRADAFADYLKGQGAEDVTIWLSTDTLNNCSMYTVKWYI